MLEKTIGFIGCGNMGSAMIGGITGSGLVPASKVIASAHTFATVEKIKDQFGIRTTLDNQTVAKEADILFLAVKPYLYAEVIKEIKDVVSEDAVIVAIAAGQSIEKIEGCFGHPVKLVRSMPNTPAMVLEAMSALTPNDNVTPEELDTVISIFNSFGKCEVVPETLMDAVTGVSGSSPAYVYMFI